MLTSATPSTLANATDQRNIAAATLLQRSEITATGNNNNLAFLTQQLGKQQQLHLNNAATSATAFKSFNATESAALEALWFNNMFATSNVIGNGGGNALATQLRFNPLLQQQQQQEHFQQQQASAFVQQLMLHQNQQQLVSSATTNNLAQTQLPTMANSEVDYFFK